MATPIDAFAHTFANMLEVISATPFSAVCSAVGFVLLGVSGYCSYRSLNQAPPTALWQKSLLFSSLIASVGFFLAAGAFALNFQKETYSIIKRQKESFVCDLYNNTRAEWLIRLISYDPNLNKNLALASLSHLGSPKFKYVFVGAYEDAKGLTVSDAVKRLGGSVSAEDRVTAIIFRVRHVFPANSRGVLQVIRKVEKQIESVSAKRLIESSTLSDEESINLDNESDIDEWSWPKYQKYYNHFCREVERFRCDKNFGAHDLISAFDKDYHPLGFAQINKDDGCSRIEKVCRVTSDWKAFHERVGPNFGARVFLIDNFEIKELGARYSIDFDKPDTQIIPDIGLQVPSTCKPIGSEDEAAQ